MKSRVQVSSYPSVKLSIDAPPMKVTWREGVSGWGYLFEHLDTDQKILSFRLSKQRPRKRPEIPVLTRFFLVNVDARDALLDLLVVMISLDKEYHPCEFLGSHRGNVYDDPFMTLADDKFAYVLGLHQ